MPPRPPASAPARPISSAAGASSEENRPGRGERSQPLAGMVYGPSTSLAEMLQDFGHLGPDIRRKVTLRLQISPSGGSELQDRLLRPLTVFKGTGAELHQQGVN